MFFICSNKNYERGKSIISSLSGVSRDYLSKTDDLILYRVFDPSSPDLRIFLVSPRQVIEFSSIEELDGYLSELYFQYSYAQT